MSSSDTATDDKVSDMTLSAGLGDSKKGTPKRVGTLNCLLEHRLEQQSVKSRETTLSPIGVTSNILADS